MEFFNIAFRTNSHLYWFWSSMGILVISGIVTWLLYRRDNRRTFLLWKILFYVYFAVGLGAVFATGGREEWRFYTANCVWFNLGLAMIYAALIERKISWTLRLGLIGLVIALLVTFNARL